MNEVNGASLGDRISQLEKGVKDLEKPLGSRDNPARSCRDLLLCSCSTTSTCLEDLRQPIEDGIQIAVFYISWQ